MSDVWQGRRVAVTGGLGFIGSNLAVRLVGLGANVTVLDLPDPDCAGQVGNIDQVARELTLIRADVTAPGPWQPAIAGADVIFHLAAQVSHSASMSDPLADLRQNAGSLLGVLEAIRQAKTHSRIVFTSTRQVYGRARSLPVDETHPLRPPDINAVHKVAAEEYLRLYNETYGIRSTTLRLANTYGPRMDLRNPGRGVLNVFIARALQRQPITVFGDGTQRRDINHVDDVVDALLLAATIDDAGPFNLGGPDPKSLTDFLGVLRSLVPIEISYKPFPPEAQTIDIGDSHCDIARFRSATGWSPKISLQEGVERTLAWFADRSPAASQHSPHTAAR